jgi:hypothetical protein
VKGIDPTEDKLLCALEDLQYDFRNFELTHFLKHIARLRKRDIICKGMEFQDNLFGLWIPAETADYIAYNNDCYTLHRMHIILHEVAHMLLNHKPHQLAEALDDSIADWIAQSSTQDSTNSPIKAYLPRTVSGQYIRSDQQEAEAEDFVTLIQNRVILANRFRYLVNASSSIENLRIFIDGLGFRE